MNSFSTLICLENAPLFSGLSNSEFIETIKCIQPSIRKYQRGKIILGMGESRVSIGIILKGRASTYNENANGDRMFIYTALEGDLIGVTATFSREEFYFNTVIAEEECVIGFIKPNFFYTKCYPPCKGHQIVTNNIINMVTKKTLYLHERISFLSLKSVRQKVCSFLIYEYTRTGNTKFTLSLNRNELSEYLNIQRPSLSRELSSLRNENLINFNKSIISILDITKLKQYL